MLKPVISDDRILQPSAITIVSSVADIFLTLSETSIIAPPDLCSSGIKYLTRMAGEIIDFHDFFASSGANLFHPVLLFCIKKRAWKGALQRYGIKRSDQ